MTRDIRESDWKILRELSRVALDRFCKRVMEEAAPLVNGPEGPTGTYHERYLALFKLLHKRDEELGNAFNDLRRSMAMIQLAFMRHYQVVTDEEFMRFSQELRDSVNGFLDIRFDT